MLEIELSYLILSYLILYKHVHNHLHCHQILCKQGQKLLNFSASTIKLHNSTTNNN